MKFNNIDEIIKAGFIGFIPMGQLFSAPSQLPAARGVYLILNLDKTPPVFLSKGTGGYFKGKDPNVGLEALQLNWVQETLVLYIGKAGSETSKATLKSRLKQYHGFGKGKNIGHWGGRLIWQLATSPELIVSWKPLLNEDPRTVESRLIKGFVAKFGKRPFANLAD